MRYREVIQHVVEGRAQGVVSRAESHGTELPGHIAAGADAAKEMGIALLLLWTTLATLGVEQVTLYLTLSLFALAFTAWKVGRSAHLGWARLERLHRIVEEERWEIEHNRPQEKAELRALYAAKGLEGRLLDEVVETLMADNDRALRVMLEEELGLALEVYEHPLKQAAGAGIGALAAMAVTTLTLLFWPGIGMAVAALGIVGAASVVAATYEGNRIIPSLVWNVALATLSAGICYYALECLLGS